MQSHERTHQERFFRSVIVRQRLLLGVSCIINTALILLCFYEWQYIGSELLLHAAYRPTSERSVCAKQLHLDEQFASFQTLDVQALVSLLDDTTAVADGFNIQDIALSVLVERHFFDIERALSGKNFSSITWKNREFFALSSEDFTAIRTFIAKEVYPYTAVGLLARLQSMPTDLELQKAFVRTKEFCLVHELFPQSSQGECFRLLLEGDTTLFATFIHEQKKAYDTTASARQNLLKKFINKQSKMAAQLLVQYDFAAAVHTLSNDEALCVLNALSGSPKWHQKYALALLLSPRGATVWQEAQKQLTAYPGFEKKTREQVVALLTHHGKITKDPLVPKKIETKIYIVRPGDSLWKIAKKFHVQSGEIRSLNNLQTDALKVGTALKIPLR